MLKNMTATQTSHFQLSEFIFMPMSTGDDKVFELNIGKMNKMDSVTEQ